MFKDLNDRIMIIDIGWEITLVLLFELIDSNTVNLILNNDKKILLNLPNNKDYIFIGCVPIRDSTSEISFPFLGKVFESNDDYKKTIHEISKRVDELVNFFDLRRFTTFSNDISVYIEEKNHLYI